MSDPVLFGFDGAAADDMSVVVVRRGHDGVLHVESREGPAAGDLAALAQRLLAHHPPPPRRRKPVEPLAELVQQSAAAYTGVTLTDEQLALISQVYAERTRAGLIHHR